MLLVDDAHGAGVLGKTGKGTIEELGVPAHRVISTITLSKAFGVYGGAVLGSRKLQQRIYVTSSLLVGNTPLPPPLAAAALAALEIVQKEPGIRERLIANASRVKRALAQNGLAVGHGLTPIIGITPAAGAGATLLSKRLLAHRIYPTFIRYPGGPRNGFFRFAISSEHKPEQLDALVEALI
jgi:7-keto-8-aminopelargonate synthetase-like enzyme